MNALHYRTKTMHCAFNLKKDQQMATSDGQKPVGLFSGYASVFDEIDSYNDRVVRGAFKDSLHTFNQQGRLPKMLWQHNLQDVIGIWHHIHEDNRGLYVAGQILLDVQKGREAYSLMQAKAIEGLSIGFRIIEALKGHEKNVRLLTKIDLIEVSLVTLPANSKASITSIT